MGTVTAEGLATEFKRLIEEGWSPDPDEFLSRVPDDLREECRRLIVELTAPPSEPEAPERPKVISSVDDIEWLDDEEAVAEPAHTPEAIEEAPEAVGEPEEPFEEPVEEVPEPAAEPPEGVPEPVEEREEPAPTEVEEEPVPEAAEGPEEPAPTGPVRLTRDEAMAMFREMERKRASAS